MRHQISVLEGRPYPLGATVIGRHEVNLAAVLPGKEDCGVILYPHGETGELRFPFQSSDRIGSVFCMKLSGLSPAGYDYNFYKGDEVVTDPCAKRILGGGKWGERADGTLRGALAAPAFDWAGDRPLRTPLCDTVLYLLHVRGFTKHASSGVRAKGTFEGIAEKISYLKELGVTAVELMPAYEFPELEEPKPQGVSMAEAAAHYRDKLPKADAEPRINFWGYKKGYYFAPKASYARGGDPTASFKGMVKQLHENGIEVIMQFYFPGDVPPALVPEVLRHWVCEYHIDGAHLMGEGVPAGLAASDPLLAETKLFCQDFPADAVRGPGQEPEFKNLAYYRDSFLYDMRRFLKGDEDMLSSALYHLRNNPKQAGVVNYMTNYEGFSLADMVSYERRHNEENGEENRDGLSYNASWNCGVEGKTRKKSVLELRQRQMRNAAALLLFAQGTPMLTAGDEFGFSRGGNNNPWCQDNAVNWLDWRLVKRNGAFLQFVKDAIRLRKSHPILHRPEELTMMDFIAAGYPDLSYHGEEAWRLSVGKTSREAGVMYCGRYAKTDRRADDDFFYIAYNMHWEEKRLALPKLPAGLVWSVVMDTAREGQPEASVGDNGMKVRVEGRSIKILKSMKIPAKEGKKVEGVTAL